MVRPIVKDEQFLAQRSATADENDTQVITDLVDTLQFNAEHCVGMAANMIGVLKQIIVAKDGETMIVMVNPKIIKQKGQYKAEEGCLSLEGTRPCTRYKEITVSYLDHEFKRQRGKFTGFTAQIIQHEIDHLSGIII